MARREANKPTTATLRPNKADSKDWDTTQNIFIEGDNLEVLKLLQKSYADKIKVIYIDPPYNTGKDFVYKDNYADNLGNYLAITGQADEEGRKLSTNTESDGRYHSNWLNMLYPRLKLARTLLKDDGIIFISIDDNEQHNLRKLCDEIFGEDNFITNYIWKARSGKDHTAKLVSSSHEIILCYSKNINCAKLLMDERVAEGGNYQDEKGAYRREQIRQWGTNDKRTDRPTMYYPVISPDNTEIYPILESGIEGCWRISESRMKDLINTNDIDFVKVDNKWTIYAKKRDGNITKTAYSSILETFGTSANGTLDFKEIFENKIFDTPKPIKLIEHLISLSKSESDLILDFFAGSGTTAQAVMQLNAGDGGNRKFICVQLPEPTQADSEAFKAGYNNIAEITKARIRKAGEKIKSEAKKGLFNSSDKKLDIGFKAFKLDTSNIRAWDGNPDNFETNLFNSASNIKENRTEEDILFEILLKNGLDLNLPIEEKTIAGKKVFNIGAGALFICLADNITTAVSDDIGKWKETLKPATCKVIFKDTGFTDVEKTNSIQILKRYGITDVNSI